jgi:hypothetical protein
LVFVEIAEHSNVILQYGACTSDLLDKFLIFDITFQQCISNLDELGIDEQL